MTGLSILSLPQILSVCKVEDLSQVDPDSEPLFIGRTGDETSVVCPTDMVPDNTLERDGGWRAFADLRIGRERRGRILSSSPAVAAQASGADIKQCQAWAAGPAAQAVGTQDESLDDGSQKVAPF